MDELIELKVGDEVIAWYYPKWKIIYKSKTEAEHAIKPRYCERCGKRLGQIDKNTYVSYHPIDNKEYCINCSVEILENSWQTINEEEYDGSPVLYDATFYTELEDALDEIASTATCLEQTPTKIQLGHWVDCPKLDADKILESLWEECEIDDDMDKHYKIL